MTSYNFSKKLVYGQQHLQKIAFNKELYNFSQIVQNIFNIELNKLHTVSDTEYPLFTPDMLGKDSNTEYHQLFYDTLRSKWPELTELYDTFIQKIILPYLDLDEAMVQKTPTFRVHLPNNVAVVIKHFDSDENHHHPTGEINFIYALTDMYDSNTVWVEKMPRLEEYEPITLQANECISFNGNKCSHYNKINTTGQARVSFDFRVLPLNYYNSTNNSVSVTKNMKYIEGGYYKRMNKHPLTLYKAMDIWDKEKEKFNSTMQKYNVSQAWEIVDLFEKKMATYAGSTYAVSVDSCTDALFLCLQYLKASGEIILPSKTWISVPCTVKQAGCTVKFKDYKWSGMYQLKPYPIYDGAVRMKKGMYTPGTYHCLSFHIRKHIPIGKGGMILTDDKQAYDWFRTVRYEGRTMSEDGINYKLYKEDTITSLGWNMYMTPEQAARGLELFEKINDDNPDQESSGTCKDLEALHIY